MEKARKEGIESPAVEECISLLESSGCIGKAWEEGVKVIDEACHTFHELGGVAGKTFADLIEELFKAMIPKL